jgi:DNA-binding XRE family transcriptional regulator
MLKSLAWRSLTGNAIKLLIVVWQRHNGVNNGEISFSVREAADVGLSKSAAWRAFRELREKGFLAITRESAFSLKTHAARCWRLTAEPSGPQGDVRATKDFMTWSPTASAPSASISQSHERDAQSQARDHRPKHETEMPSSVPLREPSKRQAKARQSHTGDTYRLPREGGSLDASNGAAQAANGHDGEAEFRARLSETRRARNLSQSAVAEMVGVARGTIANIETGRYRPGPELSKKLAAFIARP